MQFCAFVKGGPNSTLAFPIEFLAFRLPLSLKCEWLGLVKYLHEGK
jgi:hypothetical protein